MASARCTLKVQGLDCPNEVGPLRAALDKVPGVSNLGFDLINGLLTVDYDPQTTDPAALVRRVADGAGMRAEVLGGTIPRAEPNRRRDVLIRWSATAASGLALIVGMVLSWRGGPSWTFRAAFVVAIMAGGVELVPKALRGLRRFRLDIHALMTLAVAGAVALGQWDEAATVAFLFSLSEALEALSLERARRAVRSLLEIAPETAELIGPDGEVRVVPASQIVPGDRVRVRAHERVPVDGRVVLGRSSVDQQAITGESVPIVREAGDPVFAGTANGEGMLEVESTCPVGDTVVSRIAERVRSAQAGRTETEQSIDRFARWYTPMVVVLAAVVMVAPPLLGMLWTGSTQGAPWRTWFERGLVVLVIACPCALVIGTPVAVVSALAAAARRGVLIKGGQFLEGFGRLRTLAFDKTGTLTLGKPDVVEVVPTKGQAGDDVLRIAAALGDQGGHVLGRAIAQHARGLRLEVPLADEYKAVPGLGASGRVEASRYLIGSHRYLDESGACPPEFHASLGLAERGVGTSVALTGQSGPLGWIRLADRPRPEAAAVLAELAELGIHVVMLTGDNAPTASALARELGITEQRSGLLPADKADIITELDARQGPAGMVGDGVNDAPALAAARVSVALGGIASAAALETADIVLMADDLTNLPWLVRHSRRTLARIQQNIILAVGSKLVVLALAVCGLANLWMAIAADLGVSLVVVANALRLLRTTK
ncbi:MAG: cation-translocating P-type ATPase [Isosphaeraceae bacterium]